MLFNSYEFIFGFLPVSLLVFFLIGSRGHHRVAISWLIGASLFFYGWWNPAYLGLMLISILFNYGIGITLSGNQRSKAVLAFGIALNLGVLGYFKYANFFVNNLNYLTNTELHLKTIILPLAISFFTFQQIAYLVDAYRGEAREYNFLHYCLFVTFFPQLIAGPIVHHREMLPQFANDRIYRLNHTSMAVGLTIFIIGLFKKVVIADGIAIYATPVFDAADAGTVLTFFEAWGGTLAYSLQLYFDFSGYSDMAIGLGRMFGVRLPINFHSPYKADNIIDFWRRWHITLSRFLRDYLYIPLGGNRSGRTRRYVNMMITMLLGGLWHGAGWTFLIWGGLQGLYLVINHAWHAINRSIGLSSSHSTLLGRAVARTLTMLAVSVGWVFFRAADFSAAKNMLLSMSGARGISLPNTFAKYLPRLTDTHILLIEFHFDGMFGNNLGDWYTGSIWIIFFGLVALFAPNTLQIMRNYDPAVLPKSISLAEDTHTAPIWRPSPLAAVAIIMMALWSFMQMTSVSEFLYFQF